MQQAGHAAVLLGNGDVVIGGIEDAGEPGRQLLDADLVPELAQQLARCRQCRPGGTRE